MDEVFFNSHSDADRAFLDSPFLLEEIREVLWLSGCDKSSGPDGFPLGFLKKCWNFIKDDMVNFVKEFYVHGKLPEDITVYLIALIPKVDNPQNIEEFMPIFLVSYLYSLIYKLLAS